MNVSQWMLIGMLVTPLTGCAMRAAVRPDFDFGVITRVAVVPFAGGDRVGEAIADEWKRQLIAAGVEVVELPQSRGTVENWLEVARHSGADAVITGTVSEFAPHMRFLVPREVSVGSDVTVFNTPVIELGSETVYRRDSIFTEDQSYMLFTNATLGASARLVETATGMIVWSDTYTYEGIDVSSVLDYVTRYFIRSLGSYWKQLRAR